MPDNKAEPGSAAGDFATGEGAGGVEGTADPNYMYSQPGHNGAGAGDGY